MIALISTEVTLGPGALSHLSPRVPPQKTVPVRFGRWGDTHLEGPRLGAPRAARAAAGVPGARRALLNHILEC